MFFSGGMSVHEKSSKRNRIFRPFLSSVLMTRWPENAYGKCNKKCNPDAPRISSLISSDFGKIMSFPEPITTACCWQTWCRRKLLVETDKQRHCLEVQEQQCSLVSSLSGVGHRNEPKTGARRLNTSRLTWVETHDSPRALTANTRVILRHWVLI